MNNRSIFEVRIEDLLPASFLEDETIAAVCGAVSPELLATVEAGQRLSLFSRISELTEDELDHLAYYFDVPQSVWSLAGSVAIKQSVIRSAFSIQRCRGTKKALEGIIESLGWSCTIREWFEYGGDPYHFKIQVLNLGGRSLLPADYEILALMIEEYKNERSVVDETNIYLTQSSERYITGACVVSSVTTLGMLE